MKVEKDWQARMPAHPVTDINEILAVWEGNVDGFVYTSDDEVWADVQSLARWRAADKTTDPLIAPT